MNLAALVSMFLRMAAWIGLRLQSNARDISGSGHCGCHMLYTSFVLVNRFDLSNLDPLCFCLANEEMMEHNLVLWVCDRVNVDQWDLSNLQQVSF